MLLENVLTEADFEEIGKSFYRLQQVEASQGLLDFAAKPKQCSKGFACKQSCISKTRECRTPLSGQAKDYAGWLKIQIAAGAKLSPSQQADAQSQGLTGQSAAKTKAVKTKTKTAATPPAPAAKPKTSTEALADALEKGDFATVVNEASRIYDRAKALGGTDFYSGTQKGAGSSGGGSPDFILAQLWADRGYDGKPSVVSKTDIDANIKAGEIPMFRAMGSSVARFQQHFDNFKQGDYFAGKGIYGNGTYVGFSTKSVTSQRKGYDAAYGYGSGMMRMTLDKAAKVVKQTDVAKEARDARTALENWARQERQNIVKAATANIKPPTAADRKKAYGQAKSDLSSDYDMNPKSSGLFRGAFVQDVTLKSRLGGKDLPIGQVTKDPVSNEWMATDTKGTSLGIYPTVAKARKVLLEDQLEKRANDYLSGRASASIKDFDDRVRRTEAVLFGDSGGSQSKRNDGVSGRFATIKGYDAITLNDSYNTSYMVLLNRAKTRVQDTDNKGNRP